MRPRPEWCQSTSSLGRREAAGSHYDQLCRVGYYLVPSQFKDRDDALAAVRCLPPLALAAVFLPAAGH